MGYNPISERILTVRLAARPWNVTLIQVYALTIQASDTTKDEFYTCLQQVYSQTSKQDIVLLCGDFNAKIGEGAPIGKHALGVSNDKGSASPTLRYRTGYLRLMRDKSATHGTSIRGSRLMATVAIKSTTFLFRTDGYRAQANVVVSKCRRG